MGTSAAAPRLALTVPPLAQEAGPAPAGVPAGGRDSGALEYPSTIPTWAKVHEAWAMMLSSYFPDGSDAAYVTLTFSDAYADRAKVHGPKSAFRDARSYFDDVGIRQFFLACEQTDRVAVPHVHGIVRVGEMVSRRWLWGAWFGTRKSHARILPVQDGCLSYVTKYLLKDRDATMVDWRL